MKDEWLPMKDAPLNRSIRLLYKPPGWTTATEIVARYLGGGAWAEARPDGSTGGLINDPLGWKPFE
jgi:hypothetical protein